MHAYSKKHPAENQFVEISLILERDQAARLELLATNRGQSMGSLVRSLLRQGLKGAPQGAPEELRSSA